MKNLTAKQIQEIKDLKSWNRTSGFHGNVKKIGNLPIDLYKAIIEKKRKREIIAQKLNVNNNHLVAQVREMISIYKSLVGTSYEKQMILGKTGIYLANPSYGHSDYNKTRMFDINEQTLKLMNLFNSLINK